MFQHVLGELVGLASRKQGVGRLQVARKALYMATLAATRFNDTLRKHYADLRARGKESKVALVACMRKLLIYLNGLLRADSPARTSSTASLAET